MDRHLRWASGAAIAWTVLASGCLQDAAPDAPAGQVAIVVAPLSLPGVVDATYRVTVTNLAGQVVWSRDDLSARVYGDGAGGLSYVGTCDASSNPNNVELELLGLDDASGPIAATTWFNPTPVSQDVTCAANGDAAVAFDLTVMRAARQGFFDIGVTFSDIFCSAKLDCLGPDGTSDLALLFDPHTGARDTTAVLGFACTAGPDQDTHLYLDDVVVTCDVGGPFVVDVAGALGNQDPPFPGPPNDLDLFFQTAIYRGNEVFAGSQNKAYWNVALGLNAAAFAHRGQCTLTATGTASDGPLSGGATPSGQRWPLITWSVPLSDAGGRVCGAHALGDGTGVDAVYSATSGHPFYASYARANGVVTVVGSAPTLPAVARIYAVAGASRPADAAMTCPPGYRRVGAWLAGYGSADGFQEAADYAGGAYDTAWVYLCTTDAARLSVSISASSCGAGGTTYGQCTATGGVSLGSWQVGTSCSGGVAGVDADGVTTVTLGWLALCGHGVPLAAAESRHDDCPPTFDVGCPAGTGFAGGWHTPTAAPAACGGANAGVGYSTATIKAGWMHLCRDLTPAL